MPLDQHWQHWQAAPVELFKRCDKNGYFALQWHLGCGSQKNTEYLLLCTEESLSGLLSIHTIARYATRMHRHSAYAVSVTLAKVPRLFPVCSFPRFDPGFGEMTGMQQGMYIRPTYSSEVSI